MRRRERGFTLIELVLALSIVAVMVTILFGGLRLGLRAWQRGEERADLLEHARSMSQFLEQSLSGAYPFRAPVEQGSQAVVLFQGESEKVSFVTMSAPVPVGPGIVFTATTLSLDSGTAPGLAIRQKALPNFDPFEQVTPSMIDSTVTGIRFRYLRDTDGGSWEETWDAAEERALPRAIEVTLTAMVNGRVEEQPPLTIPIRVAAP
jgi:general secretion pathway protein J